jgi:superfamily II DNA/RNA helicase
VADISHIINYDIPEDPEVYVHRVGRTARMGAAGKAFTLVTRDQGEELTKVEELINMIIPQATLEGFVPRPTPSDWKLDGPPGSALAEPAAPGAPTASPNTPPPVQLPTRPRTIGSKQPLSRRHKRRF